MLTTLLGLLLAIGAAGSAHAAQPMATPEAGRSVEGRPIPVFTLGPRKAAARVLVVGSVHGDEPGGLVVARRLRSRPPPSGVSLSVIDALNPDGLARRTRQNARGVDLNRNFPTRWRRQGVPWSRFYSGSRPLSEPETRFVVRLIRRLRPHVTIWLHQPYGLVDLSAGTDPALVRRYARVTGLPARRISGGLPGIATRWQNATIPGTDAIVVELPAGAVSGVVASRHVRAIRAVASQAACRRVARCGRQPASP